MLTNKLREIRFSTLCFSTKIISWNQFTLSCDLFITYWEYWFHGIFVILTWRKALVMSNCTFWQYLVGLGSPKCLNRYDLFHHLAKGWQPNWARTPVLTSQPWFLWNFFVKKTPKKFVKSSFHTDFLQMTSEWLKDRKKIAEFFCHSYFTWNQL